eukprot:TRINITY_DN99_c0_g2_i1.p1 TRINITY_DN99_c0_g2~~TRINITY_DN99_c0_g2_i1.p1  ORF type:complete len:219 (+),score=57.25 TRINITY_DN99_c0_g2_i1:40-657(+)
MPEGLNEFGEPYWRRRRLEVGLSQDLIDSIKDAIVEGISKTQEELGIELTPSPIVTQTTLVAVKGPAVTPSPTGSPIETGIGCSELQDKKQCQGSPDCKYMDGKCQDKPDDDVCAGANKTKRCKSLAGCAWDKTAKKCAKKATATPAPEGTPAPNGETGDTCSAKASYHKSRRNCKKAGKSCTYNKKKKYRLRGRSSETAKAHRG